jgi:predicted nucleic acid-binding protein
VLVVDASVLAPVVADSGSDGRRFRERLGTERVIGPDLLRVEVASVLRRHAGNGNLTEQQAHMALEDLLAFPITVYPTAPLLPRVWELRPKVTAYDGCYVALAEAVGSPLVTADRRLARAPGIRCAVEVL